MFKWFLSILPVAWMSQTTTRWSRTSYCTIYCAHDVRMVLNIHVCCRGWVRQQQGDLGRPIAPFTVPTTFGCLSIVVPWMRVCVCVCVRTTARWSGYALLPTLLLHSFCPRRLDDTQNFVSVAMQQQGGLGMPCCTICCAYAINGITCDTLQYYIT